MGECFGEDRGNDDRAGHEQYRGGDGTGMDAEGRGPPAAVSDAQTHGDRERMNIRRLVLDVDKAVSRPTIIELAAAIDAVAGVEGVTILVTEIDLETVGMDITVEGEHIDYPALVHAIESTGSVVHSIDQLSAGQRVAPALRRER